MSSNSGEFYTASEARDLSSVIGGAPMSEAAKFKNLVREEIRKIEVEIENAISMGETSTSTSLQAFTDESGSGYSGYYEAWNNPREYNSSFYNVRRSHINTVIRHFTRLGYNISANVNSPSKINETLNTIKIAIKNAQGVVPDPNNDLADINTSFNNFDMEAREANTPSNSLTWKIEW